MAMQRHTGCHLPPRKAEQPADVAAKLDASPAPAAAETTQQPPEQSQD